jgi:hypothetical protein
MVVLYFLHLRLQDTAVASRKFLTLRVLSLNIEALYHPYCRLGRANLHLNSSDSACFESKHRDSPPPVLPGSTRQPPLELF